MTGGFSFETSAFRDGGSIPRRYTCDGRDLSPALLFGGVPAAADTLAVVLDDPDAPGGTFTHWLLWNVPADIDSIAEHVATERHPPEIEGASQGTNDFGDVGYRGPCPPEGHPPHTYRFTAYAVPETLDVETGAERSTLLEALDGRAVATERFTGEYGRE